MRRRRHRSLAVVELTPLIDVVFLLVVFFLVAADATRLARPAVGLVPGPGEAPLGTQWDHVFTLSADGAWRTQRGGDAIDPATLAIEQGEAVLLRADARAPAASMLDMAGTLRALGIDHVNLSLGPELAP